MTRLRRRRPTAARRAAGLSIVAGALAFALTGCGGGDAAPPASSAQPYIAPVVADPLVAEYLPDLTGDLYLPEGAADSALVVLVPGGSTVEVLEGVDHIGVYAPLTSGDIIAAWMEALP